MASFDTVRLPERELIEDCVHCGFCLPTCPTYVLWGEEMDSPRGRIVLMDEALEAPLSGAMVGHWDRCLGCMACVTACPSGVKYDKLIEDTRAQVERNHRRALRDRLYRDMLFELFPHPGRLRALAPLLALSRKLGVHRAARRGHGPFPRLRALAALTPDTPLRKTQARLPEITPARGERRGRVGLLQGCVQRVFFHDVNVATAAVLSAEGFEVHAPRLPRCCGALQLHTGYDSSDLARATIEAFEGFDHAVVNAAGCGSSMKDYGHVLREDPRWAERAQAFSEQVRDVSELLAEHEPRAPRHPIPLARVAYHDACHLAHAQAVRAQPRELLGQIPDLELVEPDGWELCCGSAGVYNLLEPEAADELGRRKVENLLATGADAIAAGNPGCAIQIAAKSEAMGRPLHVYHPLELIHMSIQGGSRNGRR